MALFAFGCVMHNITTPLSEISQLCDEASEKHGLLIQSQLLFEKRRPALCSRDVFIFAKFSEIEVSDFFDKDQCFTPGISTSTLIGTTEQRSLALTSICDIVRNLKRPQRELDDIGWHLAKIHPSVQPAGEFERNEDTHDRNDGDVITISRKRQHQNDDE